MERYNDFVNSPDLNAPSFSPVEVGGPCEVGWGGGRRMWTKAGGFIDCCSRVSPGCKPAMGANCTSNGLHWEWRVLGKDTCRLSLRTAKN